uniref:Uncharacterized protein n=1 Tax=Meloidogyne enterolobii TaxID=390850 RepID=A0A6V7XKY1_MELEN|nr:unnamed protein product [Meloidogyne enterolobii]
MLLPSITFFLGIVSLASCMMHGESSRNSRKERGNILEAEALQVKKRALVITTSRDSMYFKMNSAFAFVLSDIFNVHFLILNTTNENAGKIKEGLDKAFIQYDEKIPIKDSLPNTYRIVKITGKFDENSASSLSRNKFHQREYKNNYKTIENEAFTPFKFLLQDEEYSILIESLIDAEFNVAFFDAWETGALFILLVLSIENIICINNTHLNSYQFKYAGKKFPENVPEIFSATLDDHHLAMRKKHQQLKNYMDSVKLFETVHKEMDNFFGTSLLDLYTKIKGIFINSHELIDFPLGEYKPENVYYVGGIHLTELKNKLICTNNVVTQLINHTPKLTL